MAIVLATVLAQFIAVDVLHVRAARLCSERRAADSAQDAFTGEVGTMKAGGQIAISTRLIAIEVRLCVAAGGAPA